MMEQQHITPSLLGASVRCERRSWLAANDIAALPAPNQPKRNDKHLPKQDGNWMYDVRLPSGARIDGWHRDEKVAVEYKTEEPHIAHVLQGWAYWDELDAMGLKNAEIQLWYSSEWKERAKQLAEGVGLPCRFLKEAEIVAIWLNSPEVAAKETVEKATEKMREIAGSISPPEPKLRTAPACKKCPYHDFCHL